MEGALRALLDTDLDLYRQGGESWRNLVRIGAQVANTPDWGAALMDEHFNAVVLRLIGKLNQALPDYDESDNFWGYHFVSCGLLMTLAGTSRLDHLSDGLCECNDFEAAKERMATFMAGGFVELCRSRAAARAAPTKRAKRPASSVKP